MRYPNLVRHVTSLSPEELADAVHPLADRARRAGLLSLSTEERYLLCRALDELPAELADRLPYPTGSVRAALADPRRGARSLARTAAVLLDDVADGGSLHALDRQPLDGGPVVLFAANVGGQVPVAGDTLGNDTRRIRSLQPPLGQVHVASFLSLLGIETEVFNLALGNDELDDLAATVARLADRLYFLSFASNFLGSAELDTAHALADLLEPLRARGLRPRLIGGGMGLYFARETYLWHTPVEIVVGRYGEPTLADMTVGCTYGGPTDHRSNVDIFADMPNLFLATDNAIVHTPVQRLTRSERRVLAFGVDLSKTKLAEKYWPKEGAIGICSPDDLNIPTEHSFRPGRVVAATGRRDFHLANYTFKPRNAKLMTTFGNCPRGCNFCQFTAFDQGIFFMRPDDIVSHFNRALTLHPEIHMFVIDDDDFLLRDAHVRGMVDSLRVNDATRGKVFYVETVPMEIDEKIVRELRDVGFRAILLGIESPVERVARRVGKLMPSHSYDSFVGAPFVTHDAGLFTRVTAIPFYPLVTEPELLPVLSGLLNYLEYGISVSVFPIVKALPGTTFAVRGDHDMSTVEYRSPTSGASLALPDLVLPDDPVVREVALSTVARTGATLEATLAAHWIEGDFSMTIGVLAFLKTAVGVWRDHPGRTVPTAELDCLDDRLDVAIGRSARKHVALVDLKRALRDGSDAFLPWIREDTAAFVHFGLRMALDFGDADDVRGAERVVRKLQRIGASDPLTEDSLAYRLGSS